MSDLNMEFLESPSWSSRKGFKPTGIVIHYTKGGDGRATADWFTKPVGRSAHFMGFRDGTGVQQVPLALQAWHAGASEWTYRGETRHSANRFTIGVELANYGPLYKGKNGFWYEIGGNMYPYRGEAPPVEAELKYDNGFLVRGWWEPYHAAQIDWLHALLDQLEDAGIPRNLVGHEEIAMPFGRRSDPGPLFPWSAFGREDGRRTASVILSEAT
jgi:N-acetylmuramoyl-L-alanine amidase